MGHLKIIDLSSESALRFLQSEISEDEFNNIANATHIELIALSDYATVMSNTLQHCPLSLSVLREKLVEFVKEIPKMLAWKEAVMEHTVEL